MSENTAEKGHDHTHENDHDTHKHAQAKEDKTSEQPQAAAATPKPAESSKAVNYNEGPHPVRGFLRSRIASVWEGFKGIGASGVNSVTDTAKWAWDRVSNVVAKPTKSFWHGIADEKSGVLRMKGRFDEVWGQEGILNPMSHGRRFSAAISNTLGHVADGALSVISPKHGAHLRNATVGFGRSSAGLITGDFGYHCPAF